MNRKRDILIIDDTDDIRELMARALARAGHSVTTAEDGETTTGGALGVMCRPERILAKHRWLYSRFGAQRGHDVRRGACEVGSIKTPVLVY